MEVTGVSGQTGCKEMCPSVTDGVHGMTDTGIEWCCANLVLRDQTESK